MQFDVTSVTPIVLNLVPTKIWGSVRDGPSTTAVLPKSENSSLEKYLWRESVLLDVMMDQTHSMVKPEWAFTATPADLSGSARFAVEEMDAIGQERHPSLLSPCHPLWLCLFFPFLPSWSSKSPRKEQGRGECGLKMKRKESESKHPLTGVSNQQHPVTYQRTSHHHDKNTHIWKSLYMSNGRKHGYVRYTCLTLFHWFDNYNTSQLYPRFHLWPISISLFHLYFCHGCVNIHLARENRERLFPFCDSWVESQAISTNFNVFFTRCLFICIQMTIFPSKYYLFEKNNHSYSCERMKMQMQCYAT